MLASVRQIPMNDPAGTAGLIGKLGDPSFGQELLGTVERLCGAEHCTAFSLVGGPMEIAAVSRDGTDTAHQQFGLYVSEAFWKLDLDLSASFEAAEADGWAISRTDMRSLPQSDLKSRLYTRASIRERILVCGVAGGIPIGLSVLRTERQGPFTEEQRTQLVGVAYTLLVLIGKHLELLQSKSDFLIALTSLPRIEMILQSAEPHLPVREAQVCARIIYGVSTAGIASDLGIGEETVMTYRKRAYQRLSISCQRELLIWYVSLFSRMPGEWMGRRDAAKALN